MTVLISSEIEFYNKVLAFNEELSTKLSKVNYVLN